MRKGVNPGCSLPEIPRGGVWKGYSVRLGCPPLDWGEQSGYSEEPASERGVGRKGLGEMPSSAMSRADKGVGRNGDIEVPISAISLAVKGVGRKPSMEWPTWLGDGNLATIEAATSVGEENLGIGAISEGDGNW